MTDKHKAQFELINESLWLLLKKYVKDDTPYKDIMKNLFGLYIKYDTMDNRLTEEWWKVAIDEVFMKYPEKYKDSEYKDFCGDLAIGFCDSWEYEKKGHTEYRWFYGAISKAFLNEWDRLKNPPKINS